MRPLALTAIVTAGMLAAVASAATAPVGNFVTLHLGPAVGQFRGAVKSDVIQCIEHRKVRIVRISGPDVRVGKGYTKPNGHFDIRTSESSGDWYAKVKREKVSGVTCAGARSGIKSAG